MLCAKGYAATFVVNAALVVSQLQHCFPLYPDEQETGQAASSQ